MIIRFNTQSLNILGLLGVAFVILKLINLISWSWIWVLAPFWIAPVSILLVGLFFFAIALILK